MLDVRFNCFIASGVDEVVRAALAERETQFVQFQLVDPVVEQIS